VSGPQGEAPAVKLVSYAPRPNLAPMTYSAEFPFPVTREVLQRGQKRYMIFCAVCHDPLGRGQGIVVRRGFSPPPSYHDEPLRNAPVGYYFSTMTYGFGSMPDYAAQIPPRDRWAIAAYIRALQLSQAVKVADLPEDECDAAVQALENDGGNAR
jgi:mono/diheme cytochrome c family protein